MNTPKAGYKTLALEYVDCSKCGQHYCVETESHACDTPSTPVEDTEVPDDVNCDARGCHRRLVTDDADTSKRETSECRECGATFYADLNSL